jgi:restriction endonuclease S subunit
MTGAVGLRRVPIDYLKNHLLPLPPLPEQRAIVAKIEQLFSDLDNGIADLKNAREQLKIYRQAVLKKAFSGELTNLKVSKLPLSEFAILITKGSSPRWQGFNYVDDKNQLLFITSENVREGYMDYSKEKYIQHEFNIKEKKSILKKGDLLFNLVGASIGRAAIFTLDRLANINQAVAIIRLKETMSAQFLNYYLNSEIAKQDYLNKRVDVARANLSLKDVNELRIPVCTIGEQKQIVQEIESRLSVCDKVEQIIAESLEKAEALRQSILKKAFEGRLLSEAELEACRKEKDYEPASELLKKIKAEKLRNGEKK